jgi:hypothetical protein
MKNQKVVPDADMSDLNPGKNNNKICFSIEESIGLTKAAGDNPKPQV